ncbi:MAG TPA: triphosphoribosyl-dephospho-CoA synthase [Gemmatimonadaceae bacterium]|nr:triphosphoribosyl-dephospho-CoA synthase [Gemmatimonadaceae bacterium]
MIATPPSIDIGATAQLACLLEASAPKPGNVSPQSRFDDATYDDFVASSTAINEPLGSAGSRPVGQTILLAVEATRSRTATNTNLGIILLFAPLARAAALIAANREWVQRRTIEADLLRSSLMRVLETTTVADARDAYAAIRRASPGGLGSADSQDVAGEPTVTLTEAMRLAADRDGIAREWATDFRATFELAVPAFDAARSDGLDWNDAIVETYLTVLATHPDTHIVRRAGPALADEVSAWAREARRDGGTRTALGRATIQRMSDALAGNRNRANPGTTADITAAAIFIALLGGAWQSTIGTIGGTDAAR